MKHASAAAIVVVLVAGHLVAPDRAAGSAKRPHCTRPKGTSSDDTLFGTKHRDILCGRAGLDTIDSDTGRDIVRGGPDSDNLDVSDGEANDRVRGGPGTHDICFADVGDRARGCEQVLYPPGLVNSRPAFPRMTTARSPGVVRST